MKISNETTEVSVKKTLLGIFVCFSQLFCYEPGNGLELADALKIGGYVALEYENGDSSNKATHESGIFGIDYGEVRDKIALKNNLMAALENIELADEASRVSCE